MHFNILSLDALELQKIWVSSIFGNLYRVELSLEKKLSLFDLLGDSSGHGLTDIYGSHNVLKSMSLVASKTHEVFPDIPVFPAFGNNDLPGHYILPNNSDWYNTILSYWAPLILCSECPDDVHKPTTMEALNETFMDGGYYSANIAGRVIVTETTDVSWEV